MKMIQQPGSKGGYGKAQKKQRISGGPRQAFHGEAGADLVDDKMMGQENRVGILADAAADHADRLAVQIPGNKGQNQEKGDPDIRGLETFRKIRL